MRIIKSIPNLLTLGNLFFGILAIIYFFQSVDQHIINNQITLEPEVISKENDLSLLILGCYFIGLSALMDFFDGFAARLLKVESEIGGQLDSLADMVSFGVAPSILLYKLLELSFIKNEHALGSNSIILLPSLFFALCACYRLAKFNIDTEQTTYFKGLPTPAATLAVITLPFIIITDQANFLMLDNYWILISITILLGLLMISNIPILAFKFKSKKLSDNKLRVFILISGITLTVLIGALGLLVSILLLILLSIGAKKTVISQ